MPVSTEIVLGIVKARLNRLASDTTLNNYLMLRIEAARGELKKKGIVLTDSVEDQVFLADVVVWQYNNRDNPKAMPDWLKLARREKWMQNRGGGNDS